MTKKKEGNVIDFVLRKKKDKKDLGDFSREQENTLLSFTQRREQILKDERRLVKRTILSEFIGAMVVVPDYGLLRVRISNIGDKGLAFDLDPRNGSFKSGDEVAMRVYLSRTTYFEFLVEITHTKMIKEEGCFRHGGRFIQGTMNQQALFHFIKFIENISASLKTDRGDVVVSKIGSDEA